MGQLGQDRGRRTVRACLLVVIFLVLTLCAFLWLDTRTPALLDERGTGTDANAVGRVVYTLGGAALLAGLTTLWFAATLQPPQKERPVWHIPLAAGVLALCLMMLGYAYLGVWPLGKRALLTVDMHHQYAPLLSELRTRLLSGDFSGWSFHVGLGANFLPAFAYYLASPLNLLLLPFPEEMLTEAILLITLLKNAAAAAGFAACAQYLCGKRSAGCIALAVMYSCSMYMLAYSWNIMWLDVVALAPIVVLCFEHMQRTGKFLPYTLLLALSLFSNYYLAFMLCVFLVLWHVFWLLRERRTAQENVLGTARFALSSLLAGALTAALLVPTALALRHTSAAGGSIPELDAEFPLFDLVRRFFYGSSPTIRSGKLPNLYCGMAAVLFLPIYATQRTITLRRRLCGTGLTAVMLLSCTVNRWNILWHGLHAPNDLPYRFSFLTCLTLLLLAAQLLPHLSRVRPRQIAGSLAALAAYAALWEKIGGDDAPTAKVLYTSLLLLAVYAGILLVIGKKKLGLRTGSLLLLVAVTAELTIGTGEALVTLRQNEGFTDRSSYIANDGYAATDRALRRAEELAENEGLLFARMEYAPRSTCMDTALHHYNGITTFASSNPYAITCLMGEEGYAINGVNSYLYRSFSPVTDALLGIRYVVFGEEKTQAGLTPVDKVSVGGYTRYIYENSAALPIGFLADDAVRDYRSVRYAPFYSQQLLMEALTGDEELGELYAQIDLETASHTASISGSSFTKPEKEQEVEFTGVIDEAGDYLIYVDCGAAKKLNVTVYTDEDDTRLDESVAPYEPYILNAGELAPGARVSVTVSGDGTMTGNIYVMRQNTEVIRQALGRLAEGGLQLTEMTSTRLTGTVTADGSRTLLLSIPYDDGWHVTVDGKAVGTLAVGTTARAENGALLAVPIEAGEHTVVLRYRAPGLMLGLLLSLCGAAGIVLWVWLSRRPRPQAGVADGLPIPAAEVQPEDNTAASDDADEPSPTDAANAAGGADGSASAGPAEDKADEADAPAADDLPRGGAN